MSVLDQAGRCDAEDGRPVGDKAGYTIGLGVWEAVSIGPVFEDLR
jgi:hypothetical protein